MLAKISLHARTKVYLEAFELLEFNLKLQLPGLMFSFFLLILNSDPLSFLLDLNSIKD